MIFEKKKHEKKWIWLLLIALIIGTIVLSYTADINNRDAALKNFELKQQEIIGDLQQRIASNQELYRGGKGLFLASSLVTRNEWKQYVDALYLSENFPGIQAFAYAKFLKKSEKKDFIQSIKDEGFENFTIYPENDQEFLVPATFLEPFNSENKKVHGYDMWTEKKRKKAMQSAIDTGQASLSERVTLVEDINNRPHEAGFLMFLPVFKKNKPIDTIEQRRKNIDGFVYGLLRLSDIVSEIKKEKTPHIKLEIYDGKKIMPQSLMYVSKSNLKNKTTFKKYSNFQKIHHIAINNHIWTLRFTTLPGFGYAIDQNRPVIILIFGIVITVFSFITLWSLQNSRRHAEFIASRKTLDLVKSEEQFRSAMEYSPIGMALVAPDGKWLRVNKALCNIVGYSAEELLEIDFQEITHPEDLESDLKLVKDVLDGTINSYQMQKRYFHKNGSVKWILLNVSLVRDEKNKPYYFISQIQDITERKKTEEKLIQSNIELERFAYIASHDLQEPMRMVYNFSNLLQEEYGAQFDDQANQYMSFVMEAAKRMQNLVSDLLDYSRLGSEDTGFVEFDSLGQLHIVLENLKTPIQETTAVITHDRMPTLYSNPVRFSRILQNLIGNALKYRHADRSPKIHIHVEDREKEFLFQVQDNGIGIKEEYLDQVFVIFKRLHNKNEYSGTGIGLAICKKIVETFSGSIWVESDYDKGSIFYFTIPKQQRAKDV